MQLGTSLPFFQHLLVRRLLTCRAVASRRVNAAVDLIVSGQELMTALDLTAPDNAVKLVLPDELKNKEDVVQALAYCLSTGTAAERMMSDRQLFAALVHTAKHLTKTQVRTNSEDSSILAASQSSQMLPLCPSVLYGRKCSSNWPAHPANCNGQATATGTPIRLAVC